MNQIIQQRKNATKSSRQIKFFWFIKRHLSLSSWDSGYAITMANFYIPPSFYEKRRQVFDGILTKAIWSEIRQKPA